MDTPDWLQFVSSPVESVASPSCSIQEKPVAERIETLLPSGSTPRALLTPPASAHGSPVEEVEEPTIVSVSTTFYPGANLLPQQPDIIFVSSDAVFFYAHIHRVVTASTTKFNGLIPDDVVESASTNPDGSGSSSSAKDKDDVGPIVPLSESSAVLNVMMHAIYCMPCVLYNPSIPVLIAAVSALAKYGVSLQKCISPSTPLYQHLLAQSPASPVEVYSCAAQHGLHDLAVQVSTHLLTFPLSNISDEDALKMGPVYLKKMFFLHLGRVDALKRLLLPPPEGHPPTMDCGFYEQKKLTRAWALASAYLAWDARPDLSTIAMESALGPLGEHLSCEICKSALRERVKQLVVQWTLVKPPLGVFIMGRHGSRSQSPRIHDGRPSNLPTPSLRCN
ncbi:hypothetical protein BDW22DRAFT_1404769 [Trametopsis cervina]|nr:hypothetical protein BDW22DRAFT_1404769 [Trametopsis cervina]